VADLPAPNPAEAVGNSPRLIPKPANAWPTAPPGFKVTLYAGESLPGRSTLPLAQQIKPHLDPAAEEQMTLFGLQTAGVLSRLKRLRQRVAQIRRDARESNVSLAQANEELTAVALRAEVIAEAAVLKLDELAHLSHHDLLTNLPNGVFNELLLNLTKTSDFRTVPVTFPMVTVRGFARADGSANDVAMVAGTENSSQGNSLDQRTFEFTENLTIPFGVHHVTFGTKNLFYRPVNLFGQNSMGNWTFANLDSLKNGSPLSYAVSAPSATDPANGLAVFRANMY